MVEFWFWFWLDDERSLLFFNVGRKVLLLLRLESLSFGC